MGNPAFLTQCTPQPLSRNPLPTHTLTHTFSTPTRAESLVSLSTRQTVRRHVSPKTGKYGTAWINSWPNRGSCSSSAQSTDTSPVLFFFVVVFVFVLSSKQELLTKLGKLNSYYPWQWNAEWEIEQQRQVFQIEQRGNFSFIIGFWRKYILLPHWREDLFLTLRCERRMVASEHSAGVLTVLNQLPLVSQRLGWRGIVYQLGVRPD